MTVIENLKNGLLKIKFQQKRRLKVSKLKLKAM